MVGVGGSSPLGRTDPTVMAFNAIDYYRKISLISLDSLYFGCLFIFFCLLLITSRATIERRADVMRPAF